ncbi:MAG: ABC transporter substrate-binding protein, partial [Candidatus Sericytochromatia bacterium]
MSRERSMPFKAPPFSCRQGLAVAIAVVVLILLVITGRPAAAAGGQRVLSLAPSITEMAFALGLGARVVGVTTYCNYPAAATRKPRVGDALALNDELAISLKPDLILAAEGDRARLERLARLTAKHVNEDGMKLNFKVYLSKEVNANATADGSIRVYSGLMDMMN